MSSKRLILYSEDDVDDVEIMTDALRSFPDYTLVTFPHGQSLLRALDRFAPGDICLILLDINTPILNGVSDINGRQRDRAFRLLRDP